jgi:hypothetical protein
MEINALLCDHAESAEGKLFINGGGINMIYVQPQPPFVISVFVAVVVHVPYTATNVEHTVAVRLLDEDSNRVSPWAPDGVPPQPPVETITSFNVGRPPGLAPGETQTLPLAFGLQGLPLTKLGTYVFAIEVDGDVEKQLTARVLVDPRQAGPAAPSGPAGPASIPGIS